MIRSELDVLLDEWASLQPDLNIVSRRIRAFKGGKVTSLYESEHSRS